MADGSGVLESLTTSAVAEDTKTKKKKPLCRFYSKSGYCKFENKCRFLHKEPEMKASSPASGKTLNEHSTMDNLPQQTSASENNSKSKKKKCRFFNTKAGCSRGDGCKFAHVAMRQDGKTTTSGTSSTDTRTTESVMTSTTDMALTTAASKIGIVTTTALTTSTTPNATVTDRTSSTTTSKTLQTPSSTATTTKTSKHTGMISRNNTPDGRKPTTTSSSGQIKAVSNIKNYQRVIPTTEMLSSLDEDQLTKLRTREIEQLIRRFGRKKATEIPSSTGTMFSVIFTPSDPDWPFELESVTLEVMFPQDYPKKMFDAGLFQDQPLPSELISCVNQGLQKWIDLQQQIRERKDTVELPFRPFLRWLDRNLEKLFIDAAKQMKEHEEDADDELPENDLPEETFAQSYEVCPATTRVGSIDSNPESRDVIQQSKHCYNGADSSITHEEYLPATNSENLDSGPYASRYHHQWKHYGANNSNAERKDILLSDFMTFKSQPKSKAPRTKSSNDSDIMENSTKNHVVFVNKEPIIDPSKGFVDSETVVDSDKDFAELPTLEDTPIDNVPVDSKPRGTEIRFKGLELCENTSTLRTEAVTLTVECAKCKTRTDMKTDKTRPSSMRCDKCTNVLGVVLRPSMIHQHSMLTLGYLDLQGCHPFDMVMANSFLIAGCLSCNNETSIKGPQYGTNHVWCSKCHQKLQFKIESTRFIQLQPTSSIVGDRDLPMPKRKPKPPGLREGFPLPEKGTCKHYKKSFRWLRFPCCSKCYPCDVCHDEQETHEMKYATRMVCGFCSKEQPFSQGPCTACNSSTTKAKTSHWEGGKGCRNKTMMNRGDDKKFKNTNKTVSRKAQGKATQGKTKTK